MAEAQPVAERQARLAAMQGEAVQLTLKISGMTCGGCVGGVQQALAAVPGVANVVVDLDSGTAVVAGAASVGRFGAQRLIQAVADTGKEASLVEEHSPAEGDKHSHGHGHGHGGAATVTEDHHHGHAHDSDVRHCCATCCPWRWCRRPWRWRWRWHWRCAPPPC